MRLTMRVVCVASLLWAWILPPAGAAESIVVGGSGADLETFRILAKAFEQHHPDTRIKVLASIGSSGAVRGLRLGRLDLGLMARPLKEKERYPGLTVIHYADTALVFVVAAQQTISNVDVNQLKAIYRGNGEPGWLIPILRTRSDSDTLLLEKKIPELLPALESAYKRKGLSVGMTDQSTIELLMNVENAITTSSLSLIVAEERPVKILKLNGVPASPETLADGSYPLNKTLFLIHDRQASDSVRRFVEFVSSNQGRGILSRTGHIPVTPTQ